MEIIIEKLGNRKEGNRMEEIKSETDQNVGG